MKYNPFRPSGPVFREMFAGRGREIKRTDEILYQTKCSNPTNIMLIGERGIGKSSLLLVANYFARGDIQLSEETYNFLTIQITISNEMCLYDLARKMNHAIERELGNLNKSLTYIKKIWGFLQRIEVSGTGIRNKDNSDYDIVDSTIYSIVDTVKALTTTNAMNELGLSKQKDGLVILIDESDNASKSLNLGAFLKNLSETLVLEQCNNVLFMLAGLPNARDILRDSHESSLRLFEEFELAPLSADEVEQVCIKGLNEYNEKYPSEKITIDNDALKDIYFFSEGYPHFVQQICYSALNVDSDNRITSDDIISALSGKGGAIDLIGDRYYKDLYYKRIQVNSYREILKIMAEKWNQWITKSEIKKSFKEKPSTLDNGLKALRDRNIILSKIGSRGEYRLQWASFAFWIKNYTKYDKL